MQNYEVALNFLNGKNEGRETAHMSWESNSLNWCGTGRVISSYSTVIGRIYGKYLFIQNWAQSHTTAKHLSDIRYALRSTQSKLVVIPCAYPGTDITKENFENYARILENLAAKLKKARKPEIWQTEIARVLDVAKLYAKASKQATPREILKYGKFLK